MGTVRPMNYKRDRKPTKSEPGPGNGQEPVGNTPTLKRITVALPAAKHDDELISRRDAADWIGVCPHTLARTKSLKAIKFNARLLRYRVGDIKALIQSAALGK